MCYWILCVLLLIVGLIVGFFVGVKVGFEFFKDKYWKFPEDL